MSDEANPVRTLGVVGAGAMGHGIAQTAIVAGIAVRLHDVDAAALERGVAGVAKGLARLVERERLSAEERDAALGRLTPVGDLQALATVDAVIEAAPERLELKRTIFEQLDATCETAVFLASNTSSIPIQQIMTAVPPSRRARVLGLHYFNPPQVMALVELVTPLTVAEEVVAAARAFCLATGKTPVRAKDTPAFIVNRLFLPMALDAMRLWEAGVASAEDIDAGCRLGLSHALGPLATSDLVGLDVMLDVAESMFDELRDPHVAPPTILRRLVAAGHLGRKSGKGIFDYPSA